MATFGEIVYMILDLVKEHSDDAYYTEEHVIFLASKMRNLLLERKYKNSRNGTFNVMSEENKQQVCLSLTPTKMLPEGCGDTWLRSEQVIPNIMSISSGVACTGHDLLPTMVTFIPSERMPYVGYNKWLQSFIYASKSMDGHLYLRSNNPQFMLLDMAGLTAVYEDAVAAAKLSHEACMNGGNCDIMKAPFPLESALVPSCVEMVVADLLGAAYLPEDKKNDAKDGLAGATSPQAAPASAERSEDSRRTAE